MMMLIAFIGERRAWVGVQTPEDLSTGRKEEIKEFIRNSSCAFCDTKRSEENVIYMMIVRVEGKAARDWLQDEKDISP